VALPVFRELMLNVYRDRLAGPAPVFPGRMEERITTYLNGPVPAPVAEPPTIAAAILVPRAPASAAELGWLRSNGTAFGPVTTTP
jgi:hypothetical protein